MGSMKALGTQTAAVGTVERIVEGLTGGGRGSRALGQRPNSQPPMEERAVCRTLASGPPASSALPWDPAASRPRLFPALPLALGSSRSPTVPRIPEPLAPDRPDS